METNNALIKLNCLFFLSPLTTQVVHSDSDLNSTSFDANHSGTKIHWRKKRRATCHFWRKVWPGFSLNLPLYFGGRKWALLVVVESPFVKILIDFWQLWMDFEFENKIIALQQSNLMVLNGKDTQVAYLTDLSGGKIDFEFFGRGILATFQLMVVKVCRRVYYYKFC